MQKITKIVLSENEWYKVGLNCTKIEMVNGPESFYGFTVPFVQVWDGESLVGQFAEAHVPAIYFARSQITVPKTPGKITSLVLNGTCYTAGDNCKEIEQIGGEFVIFFEDGSSIGFSPNAVQNVVKEEDPKEVDSVTLQSGFIYITGQNCVTVTMNEDLSFNVLDHRGYMVWIPRDDVKTHVRRHGYIKPNIQGRCIVHWEGSVVDEDGMLFREEEQELNLDGPLGWDGENYLVHFTLKIKPNRLKN